MTQVFSVLALKGGVGKTTVAVALAHMFAAELQRRVLLVDLDPQASASEMLIGAEALAAAARSGRTVVSAFRDAGSAGRLASTAIHREVGGVEGLRGLDLLASCSELYAEQDGGVRNADGSAHEMLRRYLAPVLHEYDVVIIDCPPNFSVVTQNGLFASHGYLIPVIPDLLSTRGVPTLLGMMREFGVRTGHAIPPLGLLVVKMQVGSKTHVETLARLRTLEMLIPVFPQVIPQSNQIAAAALFQPVATVAQKWGRPAVNAMLRGLARTVGHRLDQVAPVKASPVLGAPALGG